MERSDPVPDDKKCSQCGRPLTFFTHGTLISGHDESLRQGLFKCPDEHELWSYAPESHSWHLETPDA